MLVACKSRETVLNKAIYQKKQLQNPANPGFLTSPPQAPKIFGGFFPPNFGPWGEKTLFSPHFPDPGGKIEKAVSPHNGGKKIPLPCSEKALPSHVGFESLTELVKREEEGGATD